MTARARAYISAHVLSDMTSVVSALAELWDVDSVTDSLDDAHDKAKNMGWRGLAAHAGGWRREPSGRYTRELRAGEGYDADRHMSIDGITMAWAESADHACSDDGIDAES